MPLALNRFMIMYEFKDHYFRTLNRLIKLSISERHAVRFNTESGVISRDALKTYKSALKFE